MEEQEQAFEIQRRRLAELRTARKPIYNQSYFGYSTEGLKVPEGLQPLLSHAFTMSM